MNRIGGIIANVKLSLTLRKRKQLRIVEQERSRKGYWAAVRKHHARDPLWKSA